MPIFYEDSARATISKRALATLSEGLMTSPDAREAFMADPSGYVEKLYGSRPQERDLEFIKNLQDLVAFGLCCNGCGCTPSGAAGRIINPALRRKKPQ